MEEVVCRRVEDALDGINFIEEIRSDAREGLALITAEMSEDGDFQIFLNDIEKEVGVINDFPREVEDPVISELGRTDPVMAVLVSGPLNVPDLKAYCEGLKDRMQEAGLSLIDIAGFSDHQLRVSLSEAALRRTGLSALQVAERIAGQSRDMPLGNIETRELDILLRFVDQRRTLEALENLIILATPQGGEIRLGDIAQITDVFEKDEDKIVVKGRRSALLHIKKTKSQDTLRIADKAKAFIEKERRRHPQIELTVTQDQSTILNDRLVMLITNGLQGLLLVFLTMWIFFSFKVSFWVTMGLPVSFLGAFFFVPHFNLSVNMLTMVGLLLALGLLMDDALVIAENIAAHRQKGKSSLVAAVDGTKEVAAGVLSSFITTACILGPLAFIQGQIGKVLRVVPM
ncbi:MAG: efflux RND transporter permease subunit, partial [Deltaproteobacteria bacterium]|nr:efflux RND transporter permease subunit [Deltaproteobacteria bacterium]